MLRYILTVLDSNCVNKHVFSHLIRERTSLFNVHTEIGLTA